jgi:hypothetical protein
MMGGCQCLIQLKTKVRDQSSVSSFYGKSPLSSFSLISLRTPYACLLKIFNSLDSLVDQGYVQDKKPMYI